MEKESLKRYLIFLAALIFCAGVAWYFSKDVGDPQDNAVLAGSRNLIIDLGTAGKVRLEETACETEKETEEMESGKASDPSAFVAGKSVSTGRDTGDQTTKDGKETK